MISIFSTPKPFQGHIDLIQRNAITSWTALKPTPEITLLGDEPGVAEFCRTLGISNVPSIRRNEYGTPLVSDIFDCVQKRARHDIVCYVNADIILFDDFLESIQRIHFPKFLMIGCRLDLDVTTPWDFTDPTQKQLLRSEASERGTLHGPTGIDYFVFTRGLWPNVPRFALGRTAWDNYLVFDARRRRVPVIDVSKTVLAVHQTHDYGHIAGGVDVAWKGTEARLNQELSGGIYNWFDIRDATWVLDQNGLRRAWDWAHLKRRLVTLPGRYPRLHKSFRVLTGTLRGSKEDSD